MACRKGRVPQNSIRKMAWNARRLQAKSPLPTSVKNHYPDIFVIFGKLMIDSALKDRLIDKIRQIEDPEVFDEFRRVLGIEFDDQQYQTTEEQKEAIRQAKDQIERGETLSEEQADKEIDEWLNVKKASG